MKSRVTLTVDPEVIKKAKKIAHVRRTSVSALIEDLLRQTPISSDREEASVVGKWAGKFRLRRSAKPDARLECLKNRYGLQDE
jgi:mRNA-degrading endonuclease RelE of RelBE toxin-antitoxin system